MKKIILLCLCSLTLFASQQLRQKIDSIVEIISQQRQTVSKSQLVTLQDPFIKQEVTKSKEGQTKKVITKKPATPSYEKINFRLTAIINNQAKINNRWVKRGDMISGYKVRQIGSNFTKLVYKNFYNKTLYLNKADNNIINKGSNNEK